VRAHGGKWWRFKYRFSGKEKLLSLGTYPDVSLAKAREAREDARRQLAAGVSSGVSGATSVQITGLALCLRSAGCRLSSLM